MDDSKMSLKAVNKFLAKVNEVQELQEELAKATKAKNKRLAATKLAAKYGYNFTSDELISEIANRQSQLIEEHLEGISGGSDRVDPRSFHAINRPW